MSEFQAKLLVATPSLLDPNFRQTVVLLLHATEDEAFGVVLNRESDRSISEVWNAFFHRPCPLEGKLFIGGPVFGPIIALHTNEHAADTIVQPGLFCSARKESVEKLIELAPEPLRFYFGGSGWGRNQLQGEIDLGAWYVLPASVEDAFSDPTELWKSKLELAGRELLGYVLGKNELPEDASTN